MTDYHFKKFQNIFILTPFMQDKIFRLIHNVDICVKTFKKGHEIMYTLNLHLGIQNKGDFQLSTYLPLLKCLQFTSTT